jgi:hypothetical protein
MKPERVRGQSFRRPGAGSSEAAVAHGLRFRRGTAGQHGPIG